MWHYNSMLHDPLDDGVFDIDNQKDKVKFEKKIYHELL